MVARTVYFGAQKTSSSSLLTPTHKRSEPQKKKGRRGCKKKKQDNFLFCILLFFSFLWSNRKPRTSRRVDTCNINVSSGFVRAGERKRKKGTLSRGVSAHHWRRVRWAAPLRVPPGQHHWKDARSSSNINKATTGTLRSFSSSKNNKTNHNNKKKKE